MRQLVRLLRTVLLTALLIGAAWITARAPVPTVRAQAPVVGSGPNRAGLVIRFSDGQVQTRCVAFAEQDISGAELLQRSGLNGIVTSPDGAVCSINGQGCPSDNCFCQCPFPICEYWAYYQRDNTVWSYSQIGAFNTVIQNGSLDGWSWGPGNFQQGVPPPETTFEQVCPTTAGGEATATPTATATTPSGGASTPPQATFVAAPASLVPGQCTTLSWQTSGATSVLLDGAAMALSGNQNVCPAATQTFTLTALNTAGQTIRQVIVQVQAAAPTLTWTPTATRPASGVATSVPTRAPGGASTAPPTVSAPRAVPPTQPRPIITQAPQPLPGATVNAVLPAPTVDLSGGGVPLAPTAQPGPGFTPTFAPTPTPFIFSPPPTETPRPRRALDETGPTPTPLLLARAGGNANPAPGAATNGASAGVRPAAAQQTVSARAFTPQLLPQYAAYVATVLVLLVVGWRVLKRRPARV